MSLASLSDYEQFIYTLQSRFESIVRSTLTVIRHGPTIAMVRGDLAFSRDVCLSVAEWLDFDVADGPLTDYSYEVWRGDEKLYWYDPQPHPNDPTLASTHPHHKHVPPNIKRNRIPAPDLSFTRPNLPFLIEEIERMQLAE